MGEVVAFILGLVFKAAIAALVGKGVGYVMDNLKDWPRILHYLEQHGGKSFDCTTCRLGTPTSVDGINQS